MAAATPREDFSVLVLASDLGVDGRSLLSDHDSTGEIWYDCPSSSSAAYSEVGEDFSDLELLQTFRFEGSDKKGNRILRIVGKHLPGVCRLVDCYRTVSRPLFGLVLINFLAAVLSGERLKKYIFHKILSNLPEGPFCIVYMHTTVQKEDNSPGLTVLRWIYEDLPCEIKERLNIVYFLHPGLRSRLAFATLGRFFLSGGLYWKIKYVSRLQYLWDDIRKGQVAIPEFVKAHDDILEQRPLTDYGIEPDPFHLSDAFHLMESPSMPLAYGRHSSQDYM